MRPQSLSIAAGVLAAAMAMGCRKEATTASPGPSTAGPAGQTAQTLPAMSGPAVEAVKTVVMDSVAMGKGLSPDGTLTAPTNSFLQGEPLFVTLKASDISPGTSVTLSWRGPGGKANGEEKVVVPPGAQSIYFEARDTTTWQPGEHQLDIAIEDVTLGSKRFSIAPGPARGSPSAGGPER